MIRGGRIGADRDPLPNPGKCCRFRPLIIPRAGVKVRRVFTSGASRFRPGYQELSADLDRGLFDVVVVEALDRLGRKLADVADLHDRLGFAGIKLYAVATGEITGMHIGMLGTMAQLFLADLREKTWRGQLGRALQGKQPGGKAFGYDVVEPDPRDRRGEHGERCINEAEAATVRRIFLAFADGHSPRAVARELNEEGIPGPGGRPWGDTTIRGQVDRGTGLLNNTLYIGRMEWNRCSYVKNPQTGKKVARVNKQEDREIAKVPHLRIVDDALWARVKARQSVVRIEMGRDTNGNALNRVHRRQFLLSGLLVCACCGGGYTITGKDRYACATRRSKGTCSNALVINRQQLETRILSGLKERLMAPELVKAFVDEFNAEIRRSAQDSETKRTTLKRALTDIERKIAGIMRAIEDGNYNPTLTKRLSALETDKAIAETNFANAAVPPKLRIHPNLPALYRRKVEHLQEALSDAATQLEAGEIIRSLIDRIELTPEGDTLAIKLYGDLAQIIAFSETATGKQKGPVSGEAGPILSVVAGRGFEPLTFRL
jgi:site-specific DNA recombinase